MNVLLGTILLTIVVASIFATLMFLIDRKLVAKNKIFGRVCQVGLIAIIYVIFITDSVMISSSGFVDGTSMNPTLQDGELVNMSASVTAFGNVLFREDSEFDVNDIIVFETKGFMGYDSLDAINDIQEDSNNLNNQVIKGDDFSDKQVANSTYIKRIQYIEDVNDDGIDDYYVRGDNRENELSSIDSKNFGFVDGRSVLGVVQNDVNLMFFKLFFSIIFFALLSNGVVNRFLNKRF